jgi:hypothetical protein
MNMRLHIGGFEMVERRWEKKVCEHTCLCGRTYSSRGLFGILRIFSRFSIGNGELRTIHGWSP